MDIANCGKSTEGQQTRVYREARVKRNHLKAIKQHFLVMSYLQDEGKSCDTCFSDWSEGGDI